MLFFYKNICYSKKIIATTALLTPTILTSFSANAQEKKIDHAAELEEITVTANTEEFLTNSKIVKNIELLEKQQVSNIRDLIRYDTGVSVVEQSRGSSTGFSIRGVDNNRVAISVDGLPQI
ncbi:TonB-dependent receptor plug domain-containing protein [Rodentibacter caecimuris]|uniref:TonB-dependent receptor plug domain-containing protein n=1 Tax=Rodentibacter caecimuris TaxID=1796644 RepID=A0ABX3KYE8_9PAST|nr:hypothetical protein BKG89_05520 [Rodentibacter heylii]